ncbi:MAG: hypothetical protein L6420_05260 [Elusimicrobia bacterium]|nr:hypothetical protein [Elusimicrobiota bacterium]
MAKLDEARGASIIQVIEKAEVPKKRFKTSRRKIAVNIGLAMFFFLLSCLRFFFTPQVRMNVVSPFDAHSPAKGGSRT